MIVDRIETLAALSFLIPAIPKDEKTGKNCLFVRVDGDKIILIAGGEFVVKKYTMTLPGTTENTAKKGSKKPLPEKFMVPLAELVGFKEMVKAHKIDSKQLGKEDENRLFIEIDHEKMVSHDGIIDFKQPKFSYKDLEIMFQITKSSIGELPVMPADIEIVMKGFPKSKEVELSFTGHRAPVHFQYENFEAILVPPVEKKEGDDENEQTKTVDE